jgi:hypothetical protein
VAVDIKSIRGPADQAELSLRSQQPALIGPVSWSPGDRPSCTSKDELLIRLPPGEAPGSPDLGQELGSRIVSTGDDVVLVDLGGGAELTRPGLFLDVKVDTGEQAGCLRLALTAAGGETLWRAAHAPWTLTLGVRFDDPLASAEGLGARVMVETRVVRELGRLRPFFGVLAGSATCRGADCPPVEAPLDEVIDGQGSGLFVLYGGEAGIERQVALGRWALGLTVGGALMGFHLGTQDGYVGARNGGVVGPFASVSLFGRGGGTLPGFAPALRRWSAGPELFVQRQTAFGRGPTQSAWLLGLGWRFEVTL